MCREPLPEEAFELAKLICEIEDLELQEQIHDAVANLIAAMGYKITQPANDILWLPVSDN